MRRKTRTYRWKRRLAAAAALSLSFAMVPVPAVWAEEPAAVSETGETVEICTEEEFRRFAAECVSESYSRGKRFVLTGDIDLGGEALEPAAVFAGELDGGGQVRCGLPACCAGSDLGLFRYIEEGALVRNLQVEGDVIPAGSRGQVGGIAGVCRGQIENCSFSGRAAGEEAVGGIAGYVEETGVIRNCSNAGEIAGDLKTGGIAGRNDGRIEDCVNTGAINAAADEERTGLEQEEGTAGSALSLEPEDLEKNLRTERINDTGGIAGLSLGVLSGCVNRGQVGYAKRGYNTGGIAGRQNGVLLDCSNYGTVAGRKDTGGIVGQLEPHLSVSYEEDLYQQLKQQLDAISDTGDALSGAAEQAVDTAQDNVDQIGERLDGIRDIARFYTDLFGDDADQLDEEMDRSAEEIQDILDGMDVHLLTGAAQQKIRDLKTLAGEIRQLKEQLKTGYDGAWTDVQALKQWLEERAEMVSQLLDRTAELKEGLEALIPELAGGLYQEGEDALEDLEDLSVEVSVLLDVLQENRDRIRGDIQSLEEEARRESDGLSGDADALSDGLEDGKAQIREEKRRLMDQMDQLREILSDQADTAREDAREAEQNLKDGSWKEGITGENGIFADVSASEAEETGAGTVYRCVNAGEVETDYHGGGIAGMIGTEFLLDPESDPEETDAWTMNRSGSARSVIRECLNRGNVRTRYDYAGGIAGRAALGVILQSENYGDVQAENGDYAGGIAGSSLGVLQSDSSMCTALGESYVGGIAGLAKEIRDCRSMGFQKSEGGEKLGSIAGAAQEGAEIAGNLYVDEGRGAVDGVTYESQAQGLPYEAFVEQEGVPEAFQTLTVTFRTEDRVIETIVCGYEDCIEEERIPRLPERAGYYSRWEGPDLSCVRSNETVMGVYRPWDTAIASSQETRPLLLAEGNFYPGTTLQAEEMPYAGETPEGYRAVKTISFRIDPPEAEHAPETAVLRVRIEDCPDVRAAGIAKADGLRVVEGTVDGSCLVFAADGLEDGQGAFVLLEKKNGVPAPVLIGIAAAAAAGLIFMRARNGGTKAAGRRNTASAERSETRRRKREKAEEETQTSPKETGPNPQKSPAEPPASESCSRDPRKKESGGAERPDAEP